MCDASATREGFCATSKGDRPVNLYEWQAILELETYISLATMTITKTTRDHSHLAEQVGFLDFAP